MVLSLHFSCFSQSGCSGQSSSKGHPSCPVHNSCLPQPVLSSLIKINSSRTSDELLTFIVDEHGKAKAEKSKNDDLVMSLALSVHCYKNLLETFPQDYFKTKEADQQRLPMVSKSQKQGITEDELKWLMK